MFVRSTFNRIVGVWFFLLAIVFSQSDLAIKLEDNTIPLTNSQAVADVLRAKLEHRQSDELIALANQADLVLALHAKWEESKGDDKKTRAFLSFFMKKVRVNAPKWWQELFFQIDIFPGNCHSVSKVEPILPTEVVTFANLEIQTNPSFAGFSFDLEVSHNNKLMWRKEVWAICRPNLVGGGRHHVELILSEGRVFVFGAETHGIYVEAFALSGGKPLLRFCTCYWFNFSEKWK